MKTPQQHPPPSRAGAPGRILLAVAALAVAGTVAWLYRRPPPAADVPAPPAVQAPIRTPSAASDAMNATPAAASAGSAPAPAAPGVHAVDAASARASEAVAAAMEKFRSPAEALRKVQLALNGGTPEEVLEAARTLQTCSFAAGASEAMYAMRDRPNEMPEALRKMTERQGGINGLIKFAEGEARRCQVFDQATMGRRMELFQRAHEGGAEGAAVDYLMALQNPLEKQKPDPALVAKLQADIRNAAAVGDTAALQHLSLATGDNARELGVTPAQRLGYQAAWKIIMDERHPGITAIIEKATAPFNQAQSTSPLSAGEQAEANALTQRVLDAWRRKRKGG